MKDILGHNTGALPRFRPVMAKWIAINVRYCQLSHWNDIPWSYNERASLSIFAAACWATGCIALEEYSELKTTKISRKDRKRGRCDLFVGFRSKPYIVEAKMVWPSLASTNWRKRIEDKLVEAKGDVRRTHAPNGENKLGLLIVTPTVPRNRREDSEELIGHFVEFLRSRSDICSGWVFPGKVRTFDWYGEYERTYPGTAILIKALRRFN